MLIQTTPAPVVGDASPCSFEDAGSSVVHRGGRIREEVLLDVPVVLFGANGEFEVFFGDRVPVLWVRRKRLD